MKYDPEEDDHGSPQPLDYRYSLMVLLVFLVVGAWVANNADDLAISELNGQSSFSQ